MRKRGHGRVIFKPYNMEQLNLPISLDSMIPSNHVVRTIHQVIEEMNLAPLLAKYKGGGTSSFHPKMMLKVILYGYTERIFSSRKIAKAIRENIYFMWLAGGNQPDFRTINRFRLDLKQLVESVFQELMGYLLSKGFIKLESYFLDGTKLEANANKYSFVWKKGQEKHQARLKETVKKLLEEIDRANELEDRIYGDEDLAELGEKVVEDPAAFEKLIDNINKSLEGKGKRDKSVRVTRRNIRKLSKDCLPRARRYCEQLKHIGTSRRSMSKTDPDATFMRMKEDHMNNGQLKPGYNVQIGTENQIILCYTIHQNPGDTRCFQEHLGQVQKTFGCLPPKVCADAGYGSEENYLFLKEQGITNYVKYNMFHKEQKAKFLNDPYRKENLPYDTAVDEYTCPQGRKLSYRKTITRKNESGFTGTFRIYECNDCSECPVHAACKKSEFRNRRIEVNQRLDSLKAEARDNLMSEAGIAMRKRRCIEPEPVFGFIKWSLGFKRFLLRGLDKVKVEFGLVCMAHNLLKVNSLAESK